MVRKNSFRVCKMGDETGVAFDLRPDGSAIVRLDPATVRVLVREAKSSRKAPAALVSALLRDALEDAADRRDARRTLARVKSGAEATVPWRKVKAELKQLAQDVDRH